MDVEAEKPAVGAGRGLVHLNSHFHSTIIGLSLPVSVIAKGSSEAPNAVIPRNHWWFGNHPVQTKGPP